MKSIEELLGELEAVMDRAKSVPFSSDKCIVDSEELNRIVEDIRINLPQEIRQAKAIVAERSTIVADANKEAQDILNKAQERAKALLNQEAIYKEAKEKAEKLLAASEEQASEILRGTFVYSDSILLQTEDTVNQNLETIRQARKNLREAAREKAAAAKSGRRTDTPADDEE
ncbi:MAG: ATPase [Clostridia bacterium]|nr:ATPase [Clostridia bacterium]